MLQSVIVLPVAAGLLLFFVPDRYNMLKGLVAIVLSLITGYLAISLFSSAISVSEQGQSSGKLCITIFGLDHIQHADRYLAFAVDNISRLISIFISLISFLILLYSIAYNKLIRVINYYPWFLITLGCSYGVVFSDSLMLFLTFWGILGITLYKLIPGRNEESSAAAKKTLILIGASDTIMIIGIAILWKITGSFSMSGISVVVSDLLTLTAFLALLVGSFTKAGAFPFHTWVPDFAGNAPASSTALLPASLDKLLGIYFLSRITTDLFILNDGLRLFLLSVGVITIITAVMMALVQHNYNRLLGYHSVSQVGYMILGFGMGSVIGIAGGLFHMLNNAIYKSGLFLSAGCVEYRTGKNNLEDLGGLSGVMPVTFFTSLIFAMSISGIPPFNGFASKWMIYQGLIDFGSGPGLANRLWVLWLGLAVLGSALTLASFIKFTAGIFLSRSKPEFSKVTEVPVMMWIPLMALALICIVFGVFATNVVVPRILMPVTGEFAFTGVWNSATVSLLVLISILLGGLIYFATGLRKFRREDSFIGGEKFYEKTAYPATGFYGTISEFRLFGWVFRKAEEKIFDIYDMSKKAVLWFSHVLSETHSGVLTGYVIWVFAGLIIILLIMT